MADATKPGPLSGVRVIEFAGIGPAPMCAMLFADMGAEVLRIDRPEPAELGVRRPPRFDLVNRGKQSLLLDLKSPSGAALAADLVAKADVLIEGFRPGTMERLGLGPEECLARNARLVYGRVTGFGQTGPLSRAAGHDLNFIALSGALHAIGRADGPPTPPLNLLGDYAGGSMFLAWGIVCALLESRSSGRGQVVDAAMVDGAAVLMTAMTGLMAAGLHNGLRGTNLLDTGAPFYEVFECADGLYVSIAPVEPRFQALLVRKLGIEAQTLLSDFDDQSRWPQAKARLAELFRSRPRSAWCELLEGSDACFAPVLSLAEAPDHPHNRQRGTFVEIDGIRQPAPAPRFSRTPPAEPDPPDGLGTGGPQAAATWGIAAARITALRAAGILR